jgi:hypothetical protein
MSAENQISPAGGPELGSITITRVSTPEGKPQTVGKALILNGSEPYNLQAQWQRRNLLEFLTRRRTDAEVSLSISEHVSGGTPTEFTQRTIGTDQITGVRSMGEALNKALVLFDNQRLIHQNVNGSTGVNRKNS